MLGESSISTAKCLNINLNRNLEKASRRLSVQAVNWDIVLSVCVNVPLALTKWGRYPKSNKSETTPEIHIVTTDRKSFFSMRYQLQHPVN